MSATWMATIISFQTTVSARTLSPSSGKPCAARIWSPWAATLRYPYEVRDPALYFDELPDIAIPKDMLQLAEHILDTKAADFDPSKFQDRYEDAVVAMIQSKRAGMPQTAPKSESSGGPNVINLMEALKRSLAVEAPAPAAAKSEKKPRKKIEGQREMLLPIPGKAAPKETPQKLKAAPSSPSDWGFRRGDRDADVAEIR